MIVFLLATVSFFRLFHLSDTKSLDRPSYDQLIKHRIWGPVADPKIIIVDIDERSLEKMRADFGRWPWPRETLAAALDWLNQKGASAVVFDILFADPDTLNPSSDVAFVEAVTQSSNSYFPILRLNPSNDSLSQVRADQLVGFTSLRSPNNSAPAPTLAVVPPTFDALIKTGRMGYHNIYADEDGINRSYALWEDKENWRLWSLPARLAQDMGWTLPDKPQQLIHFTQSKEAYTRISFSEVWELSQSSKGREKDPRFEDAIVIIGSTATSLFDVKVTPLDATHPGVMILANVIDNLKHHSFLQLTPFWIQLLVAWLGLGLVVWASTRIREDQMKWAAPVAPTLFLALGFASLHSGSYVYWDLTQSASNALLFFTLWAIYLNWRTKLFGRVAIEDSPTESMRQCSAVLKIDFLQTSLQAVFDGLAEDHPTISVVRLGAVNQPAYAGLGMVHVTFDDEPEKLEKIIQSLSWTPLNLHINRLPFRQLTCEAYWDRIWFDIYQAEKHWRTEHATV